MSDKLCAICGKPILDTQTICSHCENNDHNYTNRKYLLNADIYDLLCQLNKRIITDTNDKACILEYIDNISCDDIDTDKRFGCKNCIADWLNKKRK